VLLSIAAIAGLALLVWWSVGVLGGAVRSFGVTGRSLVTGSLVIFLIALTLDAGGTANASRTLADQVVRARASALDLRRFASEIASDPVPAFTPDRLLTKLRGKDVFFVFIESYGGSLLTDENYRASTEEALRRFQNVLTDKKWSARSAFLLSTTAGGQSWLAHSSLMSGLRIDSQRRYEALIAGKRPTLISDFRRAGWEAAAVMPAITQSWPEADFFGFSTVLDAAALAYRGKSFDWVTMPDQFTMGRLQQLRGTRPLMAEVALISSHFPWAPLPTLVPWSDLGDGTIFNAQAEKGEKPPSVWLNGTKVRKSYLTSIEYVLETLSSYVETFGDERLVLIIMGDHPPISFVAGDDSRRVPVHLLAGDPQVLDEIQEWHWTEGMIPLGNAPLWAMQDFRKKFTVAFSTSPLH
jgi:hypothetical protein